MKKGFEVLQEIALAILCIVLFAMFMTICEKILKESISFPFVVGMFAINIYFGIRIALRSSF